MRQIFVAVGVIFVFCSAALAANFDEEIAGAEKREGFLTLYVDESKGRILAELPAPDSQTGVSLRLVHASSLAAGLGSNPVGLDRAMWDQGALVAFRRVGGKVVAVQENTRFRAVSDNVDEVNAVANSFARSILWASDILAERDGALLVDLSGFLMSDQLGVVRQLTRTGQGAFSIDKNRSMLDAAATLNFPDNTELEAILTFTSAKPGSEVRSTAADRNTVTLTLHHSFVRLPDDGYTPREWDGRSGAIPMRFRDYAVALDALVDRAYAYRFRLRKKDPTAAVSEVVKPIRFYVDRGAPEPIRSALLEGGRWWTDAFEAAGFKNAYTVEVLPEGAHPQDVRYNVIHWVHRETRGWSYGGGITDPRTGERIKANVLLGSLRVRQDRMIFEGLVGADATGSGGPNDPEQVALARIRQLSAHEIGHSLGFEHNMAASTYGGRASVMDYPAPEIGITEVGGIDLSNAYGVGVGAWDKFTVKWLYGEVPTGEDADSYLDRLIDEARAADLVYVRDEDSRPAGASHPRGNLWDTGADSVESLNNVMRVREIALSRFGQRNIADRRSLDALQSAIVPLYLFHRYQVEAATKKLGGLDFAYGRRGDATPAPQRVDPEDQRAALEAVLATAGPAALDLPDSVLGALSPVTSSGREHFANPTGAVFSHQAAADAAVAITFRHLLHPARLARIVDLNASDSLQPSLEEVLTQVTEHVFSAPRGESTRQMELRRVVQRRLATVLSVLASGPEAGGDTGAVAANAALPTDLKTIPASVRFRVANHVRALAETLQGSRNRDETQRTHDRWLGELLASERGATAAVLAATGAAAIPPGSPIGSGGRAESCWHCDGILPAR